LGYVSISLMADISIIAFITTTPSRRDAFLAKKFISNLNRIKNAAMFTLAGGLGQMLVHYSLPEKLSAMATALRMAMDLFTVS
jgi:hypothetical protein